MKEVSTILIRAKDDIFVRYEYGTYCVPIEEQTAIICTQSAISGCSIFVNFGD
jgi:hypothetical protein